MGRRNIGRFDLFGAACIASTIVHAVVIRRILKGCRR